LKTPRFLLFILALHLVLGLVYDWATPIFEAPDEGYHFAVVHWIALGHGLPIQQVGEKKQWEQEGSQPPLYHMLMAELTFGVDMSDWTQAFVWNPFSRIGQPDTTHNVNLYRHLASECFPYRDTTLAVHLARWFTLGLSAVTIFLTYRLSLAVFPEQESLALLAAALVAFNPKAIFINASVNNDNLLMLLSTAALVSVVSYMQPNAAMLRDWRRAAGLGLLLGLAALTKVSGLVLWPIAAIGVGWGAWQRRDWRGFIVNGAIIAGMALAVSGWWFWRNWALYHELLGTNTMVAIAGPRVPPIGLLDLIRTEWRGFALSYWSVFGVFTILPSAWVHYFFDALMLWALTGGTWALLKRRAQFTLEKILLALFCLLTLAGVIRWTMQTPASQGRLMFGAIAPLSIFMAAGMRAITSHSQLPTSKLGAWGLRLGIFFLALVAALVPVLYIAPRYAPPVVVAETNLPADLHPIQAVFGNDIKLIGYTAEAAPRHPGESVRVTLYWRGLQAMTEDYALALHLFGRGTEEVGKIDSWPGGGNAPTSQWTPGAIYADTYLIPIDAKATVPTRLTLEVRFWLGDPANTLGVQTPTTEGGKSVGFAVGRAVPVKAPEFAPTVREDTTFEYDITLVGLEAYTNSALNLILYWRTLQQIPADYTMFVHVLDARGIQVFQADAPPLAGDWPTSLWIPGQAFADERLIALPSALAPGRYTLRLGLYDPASGARVAAFRADGSEWPEDAVIIKDVIEIK